MERKKLECGIHFTQRSFDDWTELKKFVEAEFLKLDDKDWVFRGHAEAAYDLDSTLDRLSATVRPLRPLVAEGYLLYQFQKAAHHHLEPAALPQTTLEWLALMQHHGAPTRLLDFTRSPYVACFFALETDRRSGSSAIWCFDAKWLRRRSLDQITPSVAGFDNLTWFDLQDPEFVARNFSKLFFGHAVPMVLPLEPPRSNDRLLVQQGLFLCPGAVDKGFQQNLVDPRFTSNDMKDHVWKLEISEKIRLDALRELHFMNVSRASLFRGLDGFAGSLGHKLEVGYEGDQVERLRHQPSLAGCVNVAEASNKKSKPSQHGKGPSIAVLNGTRIQFDGTKAIYLLDRGFLRHVPSDTLYISLFQDRQGIRASSDFGDIPLGKAISEETFLAKEPNGKEVYFVEKDTKRLVTVCPAADSEMMKRYHFRHDNIRDISLEELYQLLTGPALE